MHRKVDIEKVEGDGNDGIDHWALTLFHFQLPEDDFFVGTPSAVAPLPSRSPDSSIVVLKTVRVG